MVGQEEEEEEAGEAAGHPPEGVLAPTEAGLLACAEVMERAGGLGEWKQQDKEHLLAGVPVPALRESDLCRDASLEKRDLFAATFTSTPRS